MLGQTDLGVLKLVTEHVFATAPVFYAGHAGHPHSHADGAHAVRPAMTVCDHYWQAHLQLLDTDLQKLQNELKMLLQTNDSLR